MAKTTEQLLQQAVQIRDEQANKKNTALRVGTLFSDIIEKQEESDQTHATDVTKINEAVTENREKETNLNKNTGISGYPVWKPNTAYAKGVVILNPDGQLVKNTVEQLDSGGTYNPVLWETTSLDKENREKVAGLEINKIDIKPGQNILDIDKCIKGFYIASENGLIRENLEYKASPFIPFKKEYGSLITNLDMTRSGAGHAVYDSNFEFIRGFKNNKIDWQEGDAYVRFSCYISSNPTVNIGDKLYPYEPYNPISGYLNNIEKILDNKVDEKVGKNLLNESNIEWVKYIDEDGNIVGGTSNYGVSDYIKVEGDIDYYLSNSDFRPICSRTDFYIAFYDDEKLLIDKIPSSILVHTPISAAYMRCSIIRSDIEGKNAQIEKGSQRSEYMPYSLVGGYTDDLPYMKFIEDKSISYNKTDFMILGENLFNKDKAVLNYYINYANGTLKEGAQWAASDYIPVSGNTTYSGYIRDYAFYDDNKMYISGDLTPTEQITTPENAAYIRFSFYGINSVSDLETKMFNVGQNVLPFEPYGYKIPLLINENKNSKVEINLPDKIYAIVGDTLQLFYRGMIKAVNPYIYDIVVNCSVGKAFPRYFQLDADSVGSYNFEIKVKDNNGNILGNKSCKIEVKNAVKQPVNNLNVLVIGDSLTNARIYPKEAFRRLCKTGGIPEGLGYSNINFVGRKKTTIEGTQIGVEGNSGWTWKDYLTKGRKAITFTINQPSIMPTVESVYKDTNNKQYTMWWDYSNTSVKMLVNDMASTPPASGTLTKVSGTGDDTITYSSIEESSGNPFWHDTLQQLDIKSYIDKWCGGKLDIVYCLLTWNGQTANRTDFSVFIEYARTLFAHIKEQYPNIKIKMLGVQLPDLRYGQKILGAPRENTYTDCYGLSVTALNMNTAYQAFCNEEEMREYVEFVNISSQVDSEYNMPFTEVPVNTRNSKYTDKVGTNDVHPNEDGYNQIADVVYRNFIANFCQ